jgi:hypothetical protein
MKGEKDSYYLIDLQVYHKTDSSKLWGQYQH